MIKAPRHGQRSQISWLHASQGAPVAGVVKRLRCWDGFILDLLSWLERLEPPLDLDVTGWLSWFLEQLAAAAATDGAVAVQPAGPAPLRGRPNAAAGRRHRSPAPRRCGSGRVLWELCKQRDIKGLSNGPRAWAGADAWSSWTSWAASWAERLQQRLPCDCHPNRKAPRGGRLSTGCGCSPWHLGPIRSGVCGFTHALSGAWQRRNGDHVWEKRCSGLDLLGCDPGSGYAARGLNTRGTELAYRSLRLRDDARAASPSSPCVCRIVGAPPLCAPARVIPGRTLLEGRVRVGARASPQLQVTPLCSWQWPAGVPVPVPAETQSAQCFLGAPLLLGEAVAPVVLCTGRMDLRTAASTRQPEPCWRHPCPLTR